MAYQQSIVARVFCVLWTETTIADIDRLRREIPERSRVLGERLLYVSISDSKTPPPGDAERRALIKLAEDMLPYLEQVYLVIRAEGFRGSVLRSAMAGMMLMTNKRKIVQIVATVEEALHHGHAHLGADEGAIRRQLMKDDVLLPRDANADAGHS